MPKHSSLGNMTVPLDPTLLAQALADGATVIVAKDMITELFISEKSEALADWIAKNPDKWSFLSKPVPDGHDELASYCSELGEFLASLQHAIDSWFPLISVSFSDMEHFCGPLIYKPQLASVLSRPGSHFHARRSMPYSASARIVDAAYSVRARILSEKRICVKDIHVFRAATCLLDIKWLSEAIAGDERLSAATKGEVNRLDDSASQANRSLIRRCVI